jgi:hypothetical protein
MGSSLTGVFLRIRVRASHAYRARIVRVARLARQRQRRAEREPRLSARVLRAAVADEVHDDGSRGSVARVVVVVVVVDVDLDWGVLRAAAARGSPPLRRRVDAVLDVVARRRRRRRLLLFRGLLEQRACGRERAAAGIRAVLYERKSGWS